MILTVFQSDDGYKLHVDLKPLTRQLVPIILSGSGKTCIHNMIFGLFPHEVRSSCTGDDEGHFRPALQGNMGSDVYVAKVLDILWLAKDRPIASIAYRQDGIRNLLSDLSIGTKTLHDRFKRELVLYDIKIKEKL